MCYITEHVLTLLPGNSERNLCSFYMSADKYFLLVPLLIVLFSVVVVEVLLDAELNLLVPLKSTVDKEGRHFR